jgi:hypothetical protein
VVFGVQMQIKPIFGVSRDFAQLFAELASQGDESWELPPR